MAPESPTTGIWRRSAGPAADGWSSCQEDSSAGATICPDTGVGFAPDGRSLVFAGATLNPDGSSTPGAWGGCDGWCPQELFIGDLAGRAPPLAVPIADAEHPAFMPAA